MKMLGKGVACVAVVLGFAFGQMAEAANQRSASVQKVIAALRSSSTRITVKEKHVTDDVSWVEVDVYDGETYPLTVNAVAVKKGKPDKIIYLITTSSLNFRSSFFTPIENSLARYLAEKGYLVVGVTPREDNVPLEADHSVMASWGLQKHRVDVRSIIEPIQNKMQKPYDILGQSLGGIVVADYAAAYSEEDFKRVIILDFPSFDPETQPDKMAYAQVSYQAYNTLMDDMGVFAEFSATGFKELLLLSGLYPGADSGEARAFLGLPGNFTLDGLLHFSLINTAYLPGIIYELTGLPQEWPMVLGYATGLYNFALNPQDDTFSLVKSSVDNLRLVGLEIGSGIVPLPLLQDYTAGIAGLPEGPINWAGIDEAMVWINGELGMGTQTHGADLASEAGNTHVQVEVVPMYGHVDVIFGNNAADDVWSLFAD